MYCIWRSLGDHQSHINANGNEHWVFNPTATSLVKMVLSTLLDCSCSQYIPSFSMVTFMANQKSATILRFPHTLSSDRNLALPWLHTSEYVTAQSSPLKCLTFPPGSGWISQPSRCSLINATSGPALSTPKTLSKRNASESSAVTACCCNTSENSLLRLPSKGKRLMKGNVACKTPCVYCEPHKTFKNI